MYSRRSVFLLLASALTLSAQQISTELIVSGLDGPVDIQDARDGSGRLFVAEQSGRIRIVRDGQLLNQPFLDIRNRVTTGSERGLLGLAFPPGFSQSQRFYVNYTGAGGHTVISMFSVTGDPDVADAGSEVILLTVNQPFANHNGGQLQFGPDGLLYIALGDGGSAGDPNNNGQSLNTLLGKLLRVDVESQPGVINIPAGNPFVNTPNARGEIWAYGLRNPWRFSFDSETAELWIADVGQNNFEEVNRRSSSSAGANYGWRRMEGLQCFEPNCDPSGLVLPVHDYSHSLGCSVTGGYVYRGSRFSALRGTYLYGDFCSGRIWGLNRQNQNQLLLDSSFGISTFGQDQDGEIYVADRNAGRIYRILGEQRPAFSSAGVVNAASFEQGLVPGSLASIFVSGVRDTPGVARANSIPLPLSVEGISVTINGVAAPVLAVANVDGTEQVNVQVPWELLGEPSASISVIRDGVSSDPVVVAVSPAQPAVFLIDEDQPAVLHNDDFGLVRDTDPLRPGEFAAVYLTGLGAVSNRPATGHAAAPSPASTLLAALEASLDGDPAEVVFSGLAPGFGGLYQANIQVPLNARSGLLELVFRVQDRSSPPVRIRVER